MIKVDQSSLCGPKYDVGKIIFSIELGSFLDMEVMVKEESNVYSTWVVLPQPHILIQL